MKFSNEIEPQFIVEGLKHTTVSSFGKIVISHVHTGFQISTSVISLVKRMDAYSAHVLTRSGEWSAGARMELLATQVSMVAAS